MLDLYTCSLDELIAARRALKKSLQSSVNLRKLRIAVLGGSTTSEVASLTELLLLAEGFAPVFHQGQYGRFYEEAVHDLDALKAFRPDVIYLHTSCLNLQHAPAAGCTELELTDSVEAETARFQRVWDSLAESLGCQVIQNNFELPPHPLLGSLDAVASGGLSRFIARLNESFAVAAGSRPGLLIQDVNGISARLGLSRWFDWSRFFNYKILHSAEASLELARSLAALVRAIYGRSRKVLVLDLDNTLWGGVIGDDGVDAIQIGSETPVAEAYTAFQQYCLQLRQRGVLLAVCSKNDAEVARQGFEHPSSVLRLEHFSSFQANWDPKPDNLRAIADQLQLSLDSFVFVDDNPAEREIVRAQLPACAVPELGTDVSLFADTIDRGRYFEAVALSPEDLTRAESYRENSHRDELKATFANYGQYLDSLDMEAEIAPFQPAFMERIAQLTNKTNQFNLTTRRYSVAELEAVARDPSCVALYGRLRDKFGDNGLVSVVVGRGRGPDAPEDRNSDLQAELHIDLWLMSCRVLKRDLELAMLDTLVSVARQRGFDRIVGHYIPSARNAMVADLYQRLGFVEHHGAWILDLAGYRTRGTHIRVVAGRPA